MPITEVIKGHHQLVYVHASRLPGGRSPSVIPDRAEPGAVEQLLEVRRGASRFASVEATEQPVPGMEERPRAALPQLAAPLAERETAVPTPR